MPLQHSEGQRDHRQYGERQSVIDGRQAEDLVPHQASEHPQKHDAVQTANRQSMQVAPEGASGSWWCEQRRNGFGKLGHEGANRSEDHQVARGIGFQPVIFCRMTGWKPIPRLLQFSPVREQFTLNTSRSP